MKFYKQNDQNFTYHCEASREVVVIKWVHQAHDPCVVVPWQCINCNGEVEGGSVIVDSFTEHKTLFNERSPVFLILNCCVVYLPKSIIALCKTVDSCNGSNWCRDVLRTFYYHRICTGRRCKMVGLCTARNNIVSLAWLQTS